MGFFKIYFYVERREEDDAVHLGHKNKWKSARCNGELPAKCITSPTRLFPVDLLREMGRLEGFERKEQRKLFCSLFMLNVK